MPMVPIAGLPPFVDHAAEHESTAPERLEARLRDALNSVHDAHEPITDAMVLRLHAATSVERAQKAHEENATSHDPSARFERWWLLGLARRGQETEDPLLRAVAAAVRGDVLGVLVAVMDAESRCEHRRKGLPFGGADDYNRASAEALSKSDEVLLAHSYHEWTGNDPQQTAAHLYLLMVSRVSRWAKSFASNGVWREYGPFESISSAWNYAEARRGLGGSAPASVAP